MEPQAGSTGVLGTSGHRTLGLHPPGSGGPGKAAKAAHGARFGCALLTHPLQHPLKAQARLPGWPSHSRSRSQMGAWPLPEPAASLDAKLRPLSGTRAATVERGTTRPTQERPPRIPKPSSLLTMVAANLWVSLH